MTTLENTTVQAPARTFSERLARIAGRSPVHILLGLIALVWLVPTIGLLITSFRPGADMRASGWWTVLFEPRFTLANYERVLTDEGMGQAFLNSVAGVGEIPVPGHGLPPHRRDADRAGPDRFHPTRRGVP
jgi:alpha-glucoside transport system permease protein